MIQPVVHTWKYAYPTGVGMTPTGLGDALATGDQIAGIAATGLTTTTSLLFAMGMVSATVPIIGAVVAGLVAVGVAISQFFRGCGQTCVQTSEWADQVGPILQKNLDTYLSSPVRYKSMQAAALNNFDTVWAALVKSCNQPQLGDAGQRCISDRQAGGCHWHTNPTGWDGCTFIPAGPDGSGQACWNWFVGMRDPIANDPCVQPDPPPPPASSPVTTYQTVSNPDGSTSVVQVNSTSTSSPVEIPMPVVIGGALLLALMFMEER